MIQVRFMQDGAMNVDNNLQYLTTALCSPTEAFEVFMQQFVILEKSWTRMLYYGISAMLPDVSKGLVAQVTFLYIQIL